MLPPLSCCQYIDHISMRLPKVVNRLFKQQSTSLIHSNALLNLLRSISTRCSALHFSLLMLASSCHRRLSCTLQPIASSQERWMCVSSKVSKGWKFWRTTTRSPDQVSNYFDTAINYSKKLPPAEAISQLLNRSPSMRYQSPFNSQPRIFKESMDSIFPMILITSIQTAFIPTTSPH